MPKLRRYASKCLLSGFYKTRVSQLYQFRAEIKIREACYDFRISYCIGNLCCHYNWYSYNAVSQGLNRDSLKLLCHSQFSGFQPSLPISYYKM